MTCSPQRFLAGNRNAIRDAALTPSSVLPIDNGVLSVPTARNGSAQVALTGFYTGEEEATYDVRIVDDDVEVPVISAPVFTGEGSGTLEDIAAADTAQQITLELSESGLPLLAAAIDLEGVTVKARTEGAGGNAIYFQVDQSSLVFTAQPYSLLNDLEVGSGGKDSAMTGPEFDFDTKILGADGQIPTDAHRITFGADRNIYLQYKEYKDGEWSYYLVPELKRAIARGTVVNFVTGGRTVSIFPGPESFPDIVTLYDLLDAIKTGSSLVDVDGVVANDRSPTGQAAHELQTRTDAFSEPSSGEGSESAQAFEDVTIEPDAGTQLVVATCRAVAPADHPLASVGRERWELKSSTLGDLGVIVTDDMFEGDEFSLRIPRRMPFSSGTQIGNFTVTAIDYESRGDDVEPPPICPGVGQRAGLLGPAAVNQTLTLVWTKRPSGACECDDMPTPNLATECLGIISEGDADDMAYSSEARARLVALYDWAAALISSVTSYKSGFAFDGVPEEAGDILGVPSGTTSSTTEDPGTTITVSRNFAGPQSSATLSRSAKVDIPGTDDRLIFDSAPVVTGFADEAMPGNFQTVVSYYEFGIQQIDLVTDSGLKAAGFSQWDSALAEFQSDLASPPGGRLASIAEVKYKTLVRQAMAYAGIPQLGGANAASVSGDGCWQDYGGDFWSVVGSEIGAYAPAFNNKPYWSARSTDDNGYYSTREFAFQINIKCPQGLLYGDTITMQINSAGLPATYQVGDTLSLPIIGAQDLYLAGGQDSSLVQLWYVTGSVSGAFAPYTFNPEAPAPYDEISPVALSFLLSEGGIPFAKGDRFTFSVEGGHYEWRKDGGAWESDAPIPDGAVVFDDGLSITFTPGAAPSFAAGDVFSFRALQPWAVSNLKNPTVERWQWDEATPTLVADLGAEQDLDMAAIALHTIPDGATITLEGGTAPDVYLWTETLTRRDGVIAHLFSETRTARYVRLSLAGAEGGGIGWLWIGTAFGTSRQADVTPRRKYRFARGDGALNDRGRFLGKGRGADVQWSEAALTDDDLSGVAAMLDWVKENDDEPIVFVPQATRSEEAMLVQVADDEIDEHDLGEGNRNATVPRLFDVRLSLNAFLQ